MPRRISCSVGLVLSCSTPWVLNLMPSWCASKSLAQCANRERAYHGAFIGGGTARIAHWLRSGSGKFGGVMDAGIIQLFAEQRLFGVARLDGGLPDIGKSDACIAHLSIVAQGDVGSYTSDGIVTDFPLQLEISSSTTPGERRDAYIG